MASIAEPVDRISGIEKSSYGLIALVSILTSPITAMIAVVPGLVVGIVGAVMGVTSRTERGRLRGVRVLLYGLAILAGTFVYLALAVIVALVG